VKGQAQVESVLMILLVIAVLTGVFVFITSIANRSISRSESSMIYPEVPPQILGINCNNTSIMVFVASDSLSGTIYRRISNLNGTLVSDSTSSVNITEYGNFSFSITLEDDNYYLISLYTPNWEVSDTCLCRS
jgi:hypothetical protein